MRNSWYYHHKAVTLTLIYALCILTIGIGSYVSLAWFSSTRQAQVNFASMNVQEGYSISLRYLSYNAHSDGTNTVYNGYKKDQITTLDTSFTYASDFLSVNDTSSSGPLGNTSFAPLYCSTFCFEISSAAAAPFVIYLSSYSAPASTSAYSDSLSQYVNLAEAMDVYTSYSDGTNLDADAKAFLEATSGDAVADRFSHTEAAASSLSESWMPNSSMVLSSSGKGYFFVSIYFSNASSTFYAPVASSSGHYVHDTSGDSNVYQGLSIVFSGLDLERP